MPKPLPESKRAQILALHAKGFSRNEIARQAKASPSSVSKICSAEGASFDRTKTKDATRAKQVDLAEARLVLARRLDKAANDMLDMIDKPFQVYSFGGRNNTFASETLDSAPVDARRTIVTASAIVFDKISRIVEKDNGGLEQTVGVLDSLAGNLTTAAQLLRAQGETPAGDDGA